MKLYRVRVVNVGPINDVTIELPNKVTVIQADNGRGKTTLVNSILFAMYGPIVLPYSGSLLRTSMKSSFVVLEGELNGESFKLVRYFSSSKCKLTYNSESLDKPSSVNNFFLKKLGPYKLIKSSIVCNQREVDFMLSLDKSTREAYIASLAQLDVIDKAISKLSNLSTSSTSVVKKRLSEIDKTLEKLKEIGDWNLSELREIKYLRNQIKAVRSDPQKFKALKEEAFKKRAIVDLINSALSLNQTECPVCGKPASKQQLESRRDQFMKEFQSTQSKLDKMAPPGVVDREGALKRLKALPQLDDTTVELLIGALEKRDKLSAERQSLESVLKEAEQSELKGKARTLLKNFRTFVASPIRSILTQYATALLKNTPYDFSLDDKGDFYALGRPISLLSTAQLDLVMTAFRISVSYLLARRVGEPLPLILDSVSDALDSTHFEYLLDMLCSSELNPFSQVVLTTHRRVTRGDVRVVTFGK